MRATNMQSNKDKIIIQAFRRGRRIPELAQHDRSVHDTFFADGCFTFTPVTHRHYHAP